MTKGIERTNLCCRHKIEVGKDIPKSVIDVVLSEKCFNGKSFLEIEKEVIVTVIF